MKIYHNPRCSKSRQTLALLEEHGETPEIILYLETPPSAAELQDILAKLDKKPSDIMRKGEAIYKEMNLAEKTLSDKELINIMIANPILIERPIVVTGKSARLGRPPEDVLELIKTNET